MAQQSNYAQEHLNKLDGDSKKHGYWESYLDQQFNPVKKGKHRYVFYTYYYHGSVPFFYPSISLFKQSDSVAYVAINAADTLLEGSLTLKSGRVFRNYNFSRGMVRGNCREFQTSRSKNSVSWLNAMAIFGSTEINYPPCYEYWQDQDLKGGWLRHLMVYSDSTSVLKYKDLARNSETLCYGLDIIFHDAASNSKRIRPPILVINDSLLVSLTTVDLPLCVETDAVELSILNRDFSNVKNCIHCFKRKIYLVSDQRKKINIDLDEDGYRIVED